MLPSERRRFVAGLGVAQIISWGTLYYAFPVIAVAMEGDLHVSKPELYGAATFGLAVGSLAAYPLGVSIDRGHGRMVLALGIRASRGAAVRLVAGHEPRALLCDLRWDRSGAGDDALRRGLRRHHSAGHGDARAAITALKNPGVSTGRRGSV